MYRESMCEGVKCPTCMACGNAESSLFHFYTIKEMMFGYGEEFEYVQCGQCGLLQIHPAPPEDMGKYYPDGEYYSFKTDVMGESVKLQIWKMRSKYYLGENTIMGWVASLLRPNAALAPFRDFGIPSTDILDVGCGSGRLLDMMKTAGFCNLRGVDLFVDADTVTRNGVKITKGSIHDIVGTFNYIMLNHSFEHMWDQWEVLAKIRTLLAPDGKCLISIPVINKAWDLYRENWYQVDAPRHFFLHTEKSLRIMAEQSGFNIIRTMYDGKASQFIRSELYKRGVPLNKQSPGVVREVLGTQKLRELKRTAKKWNKKGWSDQAVFLLEIKG